jgi:hypothetical protein
MRRDRMWRGSPEPLSEVLNVARLARAAKGERKSAAANAGLETRCHIPEFDATSSSRHLAVLDLDKKSLLLYILY